MKLITKAIGSKFALYALPLGLLFGLVSFLLSYCTFNDSRSEALLINLSGDVIMAGFTITIINRLLKGSENSKLSSIGQATKKTINDDYNVIIGSISYVLDKAFTKPLNEILKLESIDTDDYKSFDRLQHAQIKYLEDKVALK